MIKLMRLRLLCDSAVPLLLLGFFLTFAGRSAAEPPFVNADARRCDAQADGFLNGRLVFWQQRLNLTDWKISVAMSRASDLKPKTLGNIHWDADKKTAVIRVLDASGYRTSCRDALPDMEMTVVHELVHLELSSLPRSPASRHEEELAVNRIADALVRLDRQKATFAAVGDGDRRTVSRGSEPDGGASRTAADGEQASQ
jgi:hypothetical protein